jgi:glycosyltransferase involved in cell wall biosynthesis
MIWNEHSERFSEFLRGEGCVLCYDVDDFLFSKEPHNYLVEIEKRRDGQVWKLYREAMAKCDVVLVSTTYLKEVAQEVSNDVRLVANGLDREFFDAASSVERQSMARDESIVRFGYFSGSASHSEDLGSIEGGLTQLLSDRNDVELEVHGIVELPESLRAFGSRVRTRPFVPYRDLPAAIGSVDVNIVPLNLNSDFCLGKSELKYLEAGACGIPTIASKSPAFMNVIDSGWNGLLVEPADWPRAMARLADDRQFRVKLGSQARQHVVESYSPGVMARKWRVLVDEIARDYVRTPKWNSWEPARLSRLFSLQLHHSRQLLRSKFSSIRRPFLAVKQSR